MEICQSCMQRMNAPADHGTDADESLSEEYCSHCWRDGAFTEPTLTMEEVITRRLPMMGNIVVDPNQGRALLTDWIAALKRWQ